MSLEQAILKHAEALEKVAIALEKLSVPIISGISNEPKIEQKTQEEGDEEVVAGNVVVSKERKPRKSKKSEEKVEEKVEEKPQPKDEFDDEEKDEFEEEEKLLTNESLKDLAKLKIADGYDRSKIKAEITRLGFEQIADMDQPALKKFDKFLKELKK